MVRRPPRTTRTDTLFPYTTLFRSDPERHSRGNVLLLGEDIVEGLPRNLEQPGDICLGLVQRGQNVLAEQLSGMHWSKARYEMVHHLSTVSIRPDRPVSLYKPSVTTKGLLANQSLQNVQSGVIGLPV